VFAVNTDILGEMRRAATVPVTAADLQKLFTAPSNISSPSKPQSSIYIATTLRIGFFSQA
jgi:hypothetical protein